MKKAVGIWIIVLRTALMGSGHQRIIFMHTSWPWRPYSCLLRNTTGAPADLIPAPEKYPA